MNLLLDLFLTFAKVGLFTFGGGYAMIALIENTCVEKKQWITHDEMMNITVIAESTPGPIAINCMSGEKIIIDVNVSKEGFEGINIDNDNHPLLDNLLSNELFDKFFKVINNYESELEDSDDSFDAAKVDALIELKTRLFESIHKDQDLKNQLNFM